MSIASIYQKLNQNPLMEFLECIRRYLDSNDHAPDILREILSGAHTVLLDHGNVYDTMKHHEHVRPRRSSHYASNHHTQYEITGVISNVYDECSGGLGSPRGVHCILFGCVTVEDTIHWKNSDGIPLLTDRMTWFQFENAPLGQQPIAHFGDWVYHFLTARNVGPCRHLSIYTDTNPIYLSGQWKAQQKIHMLRNL